MILTQTDIEHIARLARLELNDTEKSQYATELSQVFEFFDMLNEVDVSGVEETTQVTGLMNVVRADEPQDISKDMRADLIAAFPQHHGDLLAVKAVFESTEV
jgi:aspartyl-tRNA(Asn)/glutamyl-tRNA(Gln) amidotransferase subunit C